MALPASALERDAWRPEVTVAVVVEREGRFLLVEERVRGALVVNQPAGHLEPGESLQDAAVREALEETGWRVRLSRLVAVYLWPAPDDGLSYLRFTFAAEAVAPVDGAQLDHGIERVLWLPRAELDGGAWRLRSPLVTAGIDDFLAGRGVPLDALRFLPAAGDQA
jgi:8-oxo-dGTP pyrophosphatase MutT (NUDIX family)